jgi:hypothetical protein
MTKILEFPYDRIRPAEVHEAKNPAIAGQGAAAVAVCVRVGVDEYVWALTNGGIT